MASFADKKSIILGKVADGSYLNDGNQAWYDRYIASGSPDAASGMITRTDYDAGTYEGGANYDPFVAPVPAPPPTDISEAAAGETIQLFDVSTGEYVTKTKDPSLDWSINGGQWKYGTMPDGSTIRLDATVPNWRDYGGMVTDEEGAGEWTYGYQAPPAPPPPPSWDDGLQGNLGDVTQDPPTILQPTPPPVAPPPVAPPPVAPPPTTQPPQAGLPPGSGNLPPPDSPPGVVLPGSQVPPDTSWKWDYFQPKSAGAGEWGGYDQDYGVFERYQPGQDSPWGMPDIEGGNREFYQQQFGNLLRDEQGYQNRERAAQMRRQDLAANPPGDINFGDMWDSMNLPEVTMGTGQTTPTSFDFNQDYSGMSLQDIWGQVQGRSVFDSSDSSKPAQDVLNNYFDNPDRAAYSQDVDWSSFASPGDAFAAIDPASWAGMNRPGVAQEGLRTILNQVYTPGQQGATAPLGYASPV